MYDEREISPFFNLFFNGFDEIFELKLFHNTLFIGKALMSTTFRSLDDDGIRQSIISLCPTLTDDFECFGSGDDRNQCDMGIVSGKFWHIGP